MWEGGKSLTPLERACMCHIPSSITSPGLCRLVEARLPSLYSARVLGFAAVLWGWKLGPTSEQLCDPSRHLASLSTFPLLQREGFTTGLVWGRKCAQGGSVSVVGGKMWQLP